MMSRDPITVESAFQIRGDAERYGLHFCTFDADDSASTFVHKGAMAGITDRDFMLSA